MTFELTCRRPIGVVVLLLLSCFLFSQEVIIETNRSGVYPGLENKIKVVLGNTSCIQLYITALKGKVYPTDQPCLFNYSPKRVGVDSLSVYTVNGKDTVLVEKKRIIIKRWPTQYAYYGKQVSGEMSKAMFLAINEIRVPTSGFDICGQHRVKSYSITLIRNKERIFQLKNKGGIIEQKHKQLLQSIERGDIIEFANIRAYIVGEQNARQLNDIQIIIK